MRNHSSQNWRTDPNFPRIAPGYGFLWGYIIGMILAVCAAALMYGASVNPTQYQRTAPAPVTRSTVATPSIGVTYDATHIDPAGRK